MTEDFKNFLMDNKKKVDQAMEDFEKRSREFDKKISRILSAL